MYVYPSTPRLLNRRGVGSYLLNGPRKRVMPRMPDRRFIGDDSTDLTDLPLAPVSSVGPSVYGTSYPNPVYATGDNLPLAPPASVGPSVQNYSAAALAPNPLQYANAAAALAAGLNPQLVQAAFPPVPAISSTTWLLLAAGVLGVALISSGPGGRRR